MNGAASPFRVSRRALMMLAVAFLLGGYVLSQRWQAPKPEPTGPRFVRVRSVDLTLEGWLSTNKVDKGKAVAFWISAINGTDSPVSGVRLLAPFITPGFVPDDRSCWTPNGLPTCDEVGRRVSPPACLAPGEASTLHARLRAEGELGTYSPMIVIAWQRPSGGEAREALILGPIEVTSPWREAFLNAGRRFLGIAKDIAIPLAIFLIGLTFQKATQAHLESAKREEDQRGRRMQVWQGLLAQNFKDVQKYYLPGLSSLGRIQGRIEAATKGEEVARMECLFSLLLFMKRMKFLIDEIGGVQFQNRSGEDIVAGAFGVLRRILEDERRFGVVDAALAMKSMALNEDLGDFHSKYTGADPSTNELFSRLKLKFDGWLVDTAYPFATYMCLIQVFATVMEHEINRPFWEYWYEKREEFPRSQLEGQLEDLKRIPEAELGPRTSEALESLKNTLEAYLRDEAGRPKTG